MIAMGAQQGIQDYISAGQEAVIASIQVAVLRDTGRTCGRREVVNILI